MCILNDDSEIKRVNSYISVKGEHSGGEQEGRAGTGSTVRTQAGCRCAQVHQGVGGDEETEHITLLWWRFGSLHWALDICQGGGPQGQGSAHSSHTHSYPPSRPPQSHHSAVSDTPHCLAHNTAASGSPAAAHPHPLHNRLSSG